MIKRVLATILTFTLACGVTNHVANKTADSVVRIEARVPTFGGEGVGSCSGFVVANQVVLTANHCLGKNMTADGLSATRIRWDRYYDLGLLYVKGLQRKPLHISDRRLILREPLLAIGYGEGKATLSFMAQTVANPLSVEDNGPAPIIMQGGFIPGMSGGPIVDSLGNVVGIVQACTDFLTSCISVQPRAMLSFVLDAGIYLDGEN